MILICLTVKTADRTLVPERATTQTTLADQKTLAAVQAKHPYPVLTIRELLVHLPGIEHQDRTLVAQKATTVGKKQFVAEETTTQTTAANEKTTANEQTAVAVLASCPYPVLTIADVVCNHPRTKHQGKSDPNLPYDIASPTTVIEFLPKAPTGKSFFLCIDNFRPIDACLQLFCEQQRIPKVPLKDLAVITKANDRSSAQAITDFSLPPSAQRDLTVVYVPVVQVVNRQLCVQVILQSYLAKADAPGQNGSAAASAKPT